MITVMGIIFLLSAQPGGSFSLPHIPGLDKIFHFIIYAVLAVSVLFALPEAKYRQYPRRISLLVVLFCILYGISDEFHQSFVPGRFASVVDLAADTAGAVAAVLLWWKTTGRGLEEDGDGNKDPVNTTTFSGM